MYVYASRTPPFPSGIQYLGNQSVFSKSQHKSSISYFVIGVASIKQVHVCTCAVKTVQIQGISGVVHTIRDSPNCEKGLTACLSSLPLVCIPEHISIQGVLENF